MDAGNNLCTPRRLDTGLHDLHLYLEFGEVVSSIPGDRCLDGVGLGNEGDELCAWDVRVTLENDVSLMGFTPDPSLTGIEMNGPPFPTDELRINWLGPATPQATGFKIGDLQVNVTGNDLKVAVDSKSSAVGAAAKASW